MLEETNPRTFCRKEDLMTQKGGRAMDNAPHKTTHSGGFIFWKAKGSIDV